MVDAVIVDPKGVPVAQAGGAGVAPVRAVPLQDGLEVERGGHPHPLRGVPARHRPRGAAVRRMEAAPAAAAALREVRVVVHGERRPKQPGRRGELRRARGGRGRAETVARDGHGGEVADEGGVGARAAVPRAARLDPELSPTPVVVSFSFFGC